MTNTNFGNQQDPKDAFSQLGIQPGSTYEEIKKARDIRLKEAGDDLILKAKIESSYDLLLMDSLKARRLGKVSNEAINASQKENNSFGNNLTNLKGSLLTKINTFTNYDSVNSDKTENSFLNLPEGQGLTIRLCLGLFIIVLLLVAPDQNIQIILSLSTFALVISQVKRGKKILPSLGWSVVFLSCGYILGGLVVTNLAINSQNIMPISIDKIEALPALILLWIGSLVLN
ncbi:MULTISPECIES: CPP1-like family protein [unclassified Prochlorococcus]|uniref:CPP1-like family protein n=1 Tax=unclassified Prochlorococcus TaxID=2627481 RepID=UPI0005338287|nr:MULTISPECIES: CPP1-like family protein [unclassified Prochlorococcus]KGG15353.1 Cyanobacteria-specific chaperone containing DNAJ domain fused to a membrane domain [Prochlorococcus sp. MIT 0602]KGG17631.1 Cyanobacteria-specific chaperone containing DNAJ domain fused to a membrane domain [Prochlorococcus sp. MIT 0603]